MRRRVVTIAEALKMALSAISRVEEVEEVSPLEALGRVLAKEVVAPHDLPPLDNSAVDGYALRASDTRGASKERPAILRVVGESKAGRMPDFSVSPGKAAYITTGAPLPEGADAVVMVEFTEESEGFVKVFKEVKEGERVRRRGEDVKAGEVALGEGKVLRPYEVGLLAALGVRSIKVLRRPKVAVMVTGDEIVDPFSSELPPGKIRDSVGPMVLSSLSRLGAEAISCGKAKDNLGSLREGIQTALDISPDMLIICGGVSVGKDDLVKEALESLELEELFHGVSVRPGRPLLFGLLEGRPVFGLPGNPVSAILNFELIVKPCLLKMMGKPWEPRTERAMLACEARNPMGKPHLLRVKLKEREGRLFAFPLEKHGAGALTSLTEADGFLEVPPRGILKEGEEVEVKLLE